MGTVKPVVHIVDLVHDNESLFLPKMRGVNSTSASLSTRRRSARHLLGSLLTAAGSLVLVAGIAPTSASAATTRKPAGVHAQSGCGVRVYMTSSGSSGADATNDQNVKTSLQTGTDLCITVGTGFNYLSTVSGSVNTSNYDVLYIQGQNNWGSTDLNNFDSADYAVIDSFITAGGGVVFGEWMAWDACAKSNAGAWGSLNNIMPVTIKAGCDYGSNQKVRFYRWNRPTVASIDTGVASDFVFQPADFAGSLSFVTLKTGATPYYWVTWNPVLANVPAAADPSTMGSVGGVGMAGWVPAGKSGRVFSFSTTNGAPELVDTSANNAFRRLLVNALGWSGSVGGSITPDAIAVSGSAGSSVNSGSLVATNFVGAVTYSIVSGTLPAGLSLNTSTGAITGTPTYGGTTNIVIQAVGATSGSATAAVTLSFSGGVAPTTTAAPTTTVASTTTVAPTTTVAHNNSSSTAASTQTSSTTTVATATKTAMSSEATLATTGARTTPAIWGFIMVMVGIVLLTVRRRTIHA